MFGRYEFPPVKEEPYRLTLGPHSFYWFRIRKPTVPGVDPSLAQPATPVIQCPESWTGLFSEKTDPELGEALKAHLRARHWFEGKAHQLRSVRLLEVAAMSAGDKTGARVCIVKAEFLDAPPETYLLPISFADGEKAEKIRQEHPFSVLALIRGKGAGRGGEGVLFDAASDPAFGGALLTGIREGRRLKGRHGRSS